MKFTGFASLFPELCPRCRGATGRGFCGGCSSDFALVGDACERCGLPRPVRYCPRLDAPWHVDSIVAPFRYSMPLHQHVQALKYHRARKLGRALGLLLAERLKALSGGIDALVAVPMHPARVRQRGYNQAVEIARSVAAELGLPLLIRGIRRRGSAPSQTALDARRRLINLEGAFSIERPLEGLRLAIVDDVITTGATINALARSLCAAGAEPPKAWAVARTLSEKDSRAEVLRTPSRQATHWS